jgi:hypothetical protein
LIVLLVCCGQVIIRSVLLYLEKTGKKCLRNLYVQMDNAKPNKCHTLVAAMGALGLLGILRKVKLSYLKVGHSHTLGDGKIGEVGRQVINDNMPTFESFRENVKKAFRGVGNGYNDVFRLIGITDYKSMFDDVRRNPESITGM